MKFISVCSGIDAASVAWEPLGWQAVAFSEVEKFPSAVLAHHWPHVPNLGDMTQWRDWPEELLAQADILAGGTPCQAFSIAGLRNSLSDERGNLTLTYVHILDQIDTIRSRHGRPPAVCVWENVPGVLNTDDNAFGCFLAALAGESEPLQPPGGRWTDAGYVRGPKRAIAWRSLDAQYFGLAQRRQRVFVVAGAGEGFRPEEVLFEFEGVRRDSPPSRGTGEGTSRGFETGPSGGGFTDLYPTLDTRCKDGPIRNQIGGGVIEEICMATGQAGAEIGIGIGTTLNCNHEAPIVTQEVYPTIDCQMDRKWGSNQWVNNGFAVIEPAIAFAQNTRDEVREMPYVGALASQPGMKQTSYIRQAMAVRRLTPTECARLQGFPDGHTDIMPKGKPTPDGPQYKAYGNSWAVPVITWIGRRLQAHLNP